MRWRADGGRAVSDPFEGVARRTYSAADLAALVPHPAPDAHKYSRGELVLVAGSAAYPGAAVLAASAALRTGAGYVRVVTDDVARSLVLAACPSAVVRPRDGWSPSSDAPATARRPRAYAVGCGFDADDPESRDLLLAALRAASPVLVDGAALAVLAEADPRELLRQRFAAGLPTVVTPHAGEATRLAATFGLPTGDPARLSWAIACAFGVVCVAKGSLTWISDGDEIACMDAGTAALAKAGTGDVLAGMIGALLAQGMDAFDAAFLGAELHARAGVAAAAHLTDVCVTAEDVVAHLPDAVRTTDAGAVRAVGFA